MWLSVGAHSIRVLAGMAKAARSVLSRFIWLACVVVSTLIGIVWIGSLLGLGPGLLALCLARRTWNCRSSWDNDRVVARVWAYLAVVIGTLMGAFSLISPKYGQLVRFGLAVFGACGVVGGLKYLLSQGFVPVWGPSGDTSRVWRWVCWSGAVVTACTIAVASVTAMIENS